jgi:DNA-binding Lrp family transcriptional regulator
MELDFKDRKIMFELINNSKQSIAQISKKTKISRDIVSYRIKKLEKIGIIKKYLTVINMKKLGFFEWKLSIEFKNFNSKLKEEVISYLDNHNHVSAILLINGKFDMQIGICHMSLEKIDKIVMEIITYFKDIIKKYEIFACVKEFGYFPNYLFKNSQILDFKNEIENKTKIDNLDLQILFELRLKANISNIEIAKKLNTSIDVIISRIKKLIQVNYIEQFTCIIDFKKLGFSYYLFLPRFSKMNLGIEKQLVDFFKNEPIVFFFMKTLGKETFHIDLIAKNPNEIEEFIEKIRENFGEILESKDLFLMSEQIKIDYFPKGIFEKLIL